MKVLEIGMVSSDGTEISEPSYSRQKVVGGKAEIQCRDLRWPPAQLALFQDNKVIVVGARVFHLGNGCVLKFDDSDRSGLWAT